MKFNVKTLNPKTHRTACIIAGVFADGELTSSAAKIDVASGGMISEILKSGDMKGKTGQTLMLRKVSGIKADRVLLVGCGEKGKLDTAGYFKVVRSTFTALKQVEAKDTACCLPEIAVMKRDYAWRVQQTVRAAGEMFYKFDQLKSGKKTKATLTTITIAAATKAEMSKGAIAAKQGTAIVNGMQLSRDLANLPGNYCTPTYIADQGVALAKKFKSMSATVLTEKAMEKLGMGSLLSVSRGSAEPAKLLVLKYEGLKKSVKNQKPYVLVGKGVTFDTGGISLKSGGGMDEMKYDMCGAASVIGTIAAIAEMKLPINLNVIVPTVENMPGSKATKPGDIVTSMSGQTIEVLNTDAEGRLILCDALTYAERFNPEAVIDGATLTGACIVALGKVPTGLISNDDGLADDLLAAGETSHDRAWRMPLWDDYQSLLDSNFADIANIGGRDGGMITAGCFLSRFTKKYNWAHLDIAGTAWLSGKNKGATGRPVSLLVQYLMDRA